MKTFFLLMLSSTLWANGPKYTYPENRKLDDEMQNVYHDIKTVPNGIFKASSMTLQGITVDSMTVNSMLDMTTHKIVNLANGTAATDAAAFGQITSYQAAVQSITHAAFSTTSNTYQNTTLTATITPSSASSRIKITVTGVLQSGNPNLTAAVLTVKRGAADIGGSGGLARVDGTATTQISTAVGVTYIDSPTTTSPTTYTVAILSTDNTTSCSFTPLSNTAILILEEVK